MVKSMCEVCFENTNFERIKITENVKIRDINFDVVHEYDKCLKCGELFEPLEDIDKNINKDYEIFRKKSGYLKPTEVKDIREKYKMTVREFASILGIGYSTLSNIENGALQNDYQNALFVLASSPTAMYKHIKKRKDYIDEVISDNIIQNIEELCLIEKPELQDISKKVKYLSEMTVHLTRRLNVIEYDLNESEETSRIKKEKVSDTKWTKTFENILIQN